MGPPAFRVKVPAVVLAWYFCPCGLRLLLELFHLLFSVADRSGVPSGVVVPSVGGVLVVVVAAGEPSLASLVASWPLLLVSSVVPLSLAVPVVAVVVRQVHEALVLPPLAVLPLVAGSVAFSWPLIVC